MRTVVVHPRVDAALSAGRPVVALETAVLTHGLPRAAAGPPPEPWPGWDPDAPLNLETVRAMARVVTAGGAQPAVVAVLDGDLRIGLDDDELAGLAAAPARKVAAPTLAGALVDGVSAGTTVSATLIACGLPAAGPIRVFATGGIGGVHTGWTHRPDVSADLTQLRGSPVCVVCAGAKSILDLPATLEALETLGVPVLGLGTDHFPRFHAPGDATLPVPSRVDDATGAATWGRTLWDTLGSDTGVLLTVPPPAAHAMAPDDLAAAVDAANQAADDAGASGAARTPFVLDALARITDGASLRANVALLVNNAAVAAAVAVALANGP